MDAFASIISNNLNITMKVLTSLTMVPVRAHDHRLPVGDERPCAL